MTHHTLDRWLLVNYAGYPFTPSSLMPDNGLANLAAVLRDAGRAVAILDCATVSVFSRFTSPRLARHLVETWRLACPRDGARLTTLQKLRLLPALQYGESIRRLRQRAFLRELGRELAGRVRRERVEAVGFKLWNGDGIEGAATLARAVREQCPGVRIFGGGPLVDVFMERILRRFDVFDALVYGEGEETIRRLAEQGGALPDGRADCPNLLVRVDGRIERTPPRMVPSLDELPLPAYDASVYPAMAGDEKIHIAVIDESRGCGNNCAFCIHPVKSHRQIRVKSLPRLLREIDALRAEHGISSFRFAGSCTPYPLLNRFAAEVLRSGRKLLYSSFAHIREGDTADFHAVKASGCVALFFGVESGSPAILASMRKGITPEMIRRTLSAAKKAGIYTVASLIFPSPGETAATRAETLDILRQTRPDAVTVTPPIVIPRTDWFESAREYGIDIRNPEKCLNRALGWKVKFLMPPAFWRNMPVRINGMSYRRALRDTGEMTGDVEREGMDTAITDEACLMSHLAGMSPRAFRDESRLAFFAGDADRVRELVRLINAGSASLRNRTGT